VNKKYRGGGGQWEKGGSLFGNFPYGLSSREQERKEETKSKRVVRSAFGLEARALTGKKSAEPEEVDSRETGGGK